MWVMDSSKRVMGTPEQAARKAVEHGLSFVCLAACWQDGPGKHRPMNEFDLADYGKAFRAAGVLPWVWGYPWSEPEQILAFVARMRHAADDASAVGIVLDPELGFRGEHRAMQDLLKRTIDSIDEGLGLGFSSYGLPRSMPDFPWSEAGGHGWGSPQCYKMPLAQAREGIRQWGSHGWHDIVVSLPTFGRNTDAESGEPDLDKSVDAKLLAYASALLALTDGAGAFWQWQTTSEQEWRTIKLLSEMHDFVPPGGRV